jgi:hypothetical protein
MVLIKSMSHDWGWHQRTASAYSTTGIRDSTKACAAQHSTAMSNMVLIKSMSQDQRWHQQTIDSKHTWHHRYLRVQVGLRSTAMCTMGLKHDWGRHHQAAGTRAAPYVLKTPSRLAQHSAAAQVQQHKCSSTSAAASNWLKPMRQHTSKSAGLYGSLAWHAYIVLPLPPLTP